MKKGLVFGLAILCIHILLGCAENKTQAQSAQKGDSTSVPKNTMGNEDNANASIVYLTYNGTATDDGNITGKNTGEEFHLFMKNDNQIVVYVISPSNYKLWSSKKIMPAQLKPMMQTYKADIAASKKLDNADNSVTYYEITSLNSLTETEDAD